MLVQRVLDAVGGWGADALEDRQRVPQVPGGFGAAVTARRAGAARSAPGVLGGTGSGEEVMRRSSLKPAPGTPGQLPVREDVPQVGVLVYPQVEAGHHVMNPPGQALHRAVAGVADLVVAGGHPVRAGIPAGELDVLAGLRRVEHHVPPVVEGDVAGAEEHQVPWAGMVALRDGRGSGPHLLRRAWQPHAYV